MKDTCYRVYCWENSITNKKYIGYTGDGILFRWYRHLQNARNGVDTYFYRSIRKYGIDIWKCSELEQTSDLKHARFLEKQYIDQMQTLAPNGYNGTKGGEGGNTWFGPKIVERKKLFSEITSGENNPRYSGYTDDEIVNKAIFLYEHNGNKWIPKKWKEYCKMNGMPISYSNFRFSEYGCSYKGFKTLLYKSLKERGHTDITLDYEKTQDHKVNIANKVKGRMWVTEHQTGKFRHIYPHEFDISIHIKGRIHAKN